MDANKYGTFLRNFPHQLFPKYFSKRLYEIIDVFSNRIIHPYINYLGGGGTENTMTATQKNIAIFDIIKKPSEYLNQLVISSALEMCRAKEYLLAKEFLFAVITDKNNKPCQLRWLHSDVIILYIFTDISCEESCFDLSPIISNFSTIGDIRDCYYQLKFLIRRVQFSLAPSLQQELIAYVKSRNISRTAIEHFLSPYMGVSDEDKGKFWKQFDEIKENSLPFIEKNTESSSKPFHNDCIFSFIICVNDSMYYEEITHYINNLCMPEDYGLEIIPIFNACSMASAYNTGMKQAIGKYKIYIHQDTFLVNKNMLFELLDVFHMDDTIGMVGVAGSDLLCPSGIWWSDEPPDKMKRSDLYQDNIMDCQDTSAKHPIESFLPITMIDGLFIATSKDIHWREDLFHGFHHYDVSQSQEFIRAGYQVVIPKQKQLWCLHDQKFYKTPDLSYEESRQTFIKEYVNHGFSKI